MIKSRKTLSLIAEKNYFFKMLYTSVFLQFLPLKHKTLVIKKCLTFLSFNVIMEVFHDLNKKVLLFIEHTVYVRWLKEACKRITCINWSFNGINGFPSLSKIVIKVFLWNPSSWARRIIKVDGSFWKIFWAMMFSVLFLRNY